MKQNNLTSASFKVVVVGASSVGKSCIVQRLVHGQFNEETAFTCGADFYTYSCPVSDKTVRLQIWDTAGQERFRSISKSYFRNAVGALLVFDITKMSSFDQLTEWLNDLETLCLPNAHIILIGNKCDIEDHREVTTQSGQDFANKHKIDYIETSALTGENITEAFTRISYKIAADITNGKIVATPALKAPPVALVASGRNSNPNQIKRSCC